jgi:hypothetical protein
LVAAHGDEGAALIEQIDQFAQREGMMSRGRGVAGQVHRNQAGTIELGVTTHLGPVGAVVDVYTASGDLDSGFRNRWSDFLGTEIAPRWNVRDCSEAPDFETRRHG